MKSCYLSDIDKKLIWHPFTFSETTSKNIVITKAKDTLLFDEDGKSYIDAISSWWVNLHGHCNEYISTRIKKQLENLEHVIFAGFSHKPAIELSEQICKLWFKEIDNYGKVFFSDDGSTSVEVALKMAIQYNNITNLKNRSKIIALRNSYHGDTFGSMSVSERGLFTLPFYPYLFEVIFIQPPYRGFEEKAISDLKKYADDAIAFIFEPLVQGAGGMLMYEAEPLDELINICKEKQIITIADEVMTGFYRTGKMFASDYLNNKPDIICLSKGITGGFLPLGLTVCQKIIANVFVEPDYKKIFCHGHSYTANPLACSAAIASLELLSKPETIAKIHSIISQYNLLKDALSQYSSVCDIRHKGTIFAIEYKTKEKSGYFNILREKAYNFFITRGILLRPLGNVIYLIPPYCITNEELQKVFNAVIEFTELVRKEYR